MSRVQNIVLAGVLVLAVRAAISEPDSGVRREGDHPCELGRAPLADARRTAPPARANVDLHSGQQSVVETAPPVAAASATAVDISQFTAAGGLSNRAPAGYVSPGGRWPSAATGREHIFECSPLAVEEGEPLCGPGYEDTYNGGCNSTPPVFQSITCGDVILGQSGTYSHWGEAVRDTDWYVYSPTQPEKLTWTVTAEFPVVTCLIDGTIDCWAVHFMDELPFMQRAMADPCKPAVIEKCVPAGTYWLYVAPAVFDGVTCGAQYCAELACEPCTTASDIACPPDAYRGLWQLAYGQDEAWQIFASNDRFPGYDPANGILLYERFVGIGGDIEDIHWWGCSAAYDDEGKLTECPLEPGNFHGAFWAHNRYTNHPLYEPDEVHYPGVAAPLYEFDISGSDLTKTDTGHRYVKRNGDGSVIFDLTLWSWGCDLPVPLTAFDGWISIQNSDDCAFWWAASPPWWGVSDGVHVGEDQSISPPARQDLAADLSWCLTTDFTWPFTGACCDTVLGQCRNTTSDECVGSSEEWHAAQLCSAIQCPAERWACCEGSGSSVICSIFELANCTGDWYRFYVCLPTDPGYDPNFFGPGIDNVKICPPVPPDCPITCDTPAAFSRGLTGGFLYISWDRGPGDQRYVIDSFTGFSGAINRMKWWGNSVIVWDGPDCDFDQPAPFAIRFYHTSGSGPDYNNPAMVYDPIYVDWYPTGFIWTGCGHEWGSIDCYTVTLPTPHNPGTGTQWVSIAAKDPECDYIWDPGSTGGTPGQWFYDNGVCQAVGTDTHRSFCLHTNILTGACCNEITGVCTNAVPETDCLPENGEMFYPRTTCAAVPEPGCYAHLGACCDHNDATCTITLGPDCTGPGEVWLGRDSTCEQCCVALCPVAPTGVPEGEPVCGPEYEDTYNMGCFTAGGWSSANFVPIADGQTICGQSGIYTVAGETRRDMDFYVYELTDPCAIVQAKVKAEFTPDVSLMAGECYTDTWCGQEQTYVLTYSQASAEPCRYTIASAPLFGPATYYIMVSCMGELGDVPCGTPYTLQIEKQPAAPCTIGEDTALSSQAACLALGGTWGDPGECALGACCFDCQCSMAGESACAGYFMGAGTTCAPTNACCLQKADANCDGVVNAFDIDPFVLALTNRQAWCASHACDYYCAADCNGDGAVNAFDIDPFVACVVAGGCEPE